MNISIAQYDIIWEDKTANLHKISSIVSTLNGNTDLVILPEMCTTGFSMNVESLAECNDGASISCLKKISKDNQIAICGSFIAKESGYFFNRAFFINSDKVLFYDKRHLFRMGDEGLHYQAGESKLIFEYKGFNICLLICYDLRFPVWARNINNEYDLLIYVANWPSSRIEVWKSLLITRAIENLSYVCGVNRVGRDKMGIEYNGNSIIVDSKGKVLSTIKDDEQIETIELDLNNLINFRVKFPVWKDADSFQILGKNENY